MKHHGLITKASVDALAVGDRIYSTEQAGFYVERGKKLVRFGLMATRPRKRGKGGGSIEMKIGRFPQWQPRAALLKAKEYALMIQRGEDPRDNPPPGEEDQGTTFKEAWEHQEHLLLRMVEKDKRSPKTLRHYRTCFKCLAEWHDQSLTWIVTQRIHRQSVLSHMHEKLTDLRGERTANAALAFARQIYLKAQNDDPSLKIAWPPKAVTFHEMGMTTGTKAEQFDIGKWNAKRLALPSERDQLWALFVLATGARKQDYQQLRWKDVDLIGRTAHFSKPKGHHAAKPRDFTAHLNSIALDCLRELAKKRRTQDPEALVFKPTKGKVATWPWDRVKDNMGPHVLRAVFINISERPELGLSDAVRFAMANHRLPGARRRYVFSPETVAAYDAVGAVLAKALGLEAEEPHSLEPVADREPATVTALHGLQAVG